MPTGYTSIIDDDERVTFERFVWRCARGMGALIMMRDDGLNAKVPERFEPDGHYAKSVTEAEAEVVKLRAMTAAQIERAARADQTTEAAHDAEYEAKKRVVTARYDAMVAQVQAWRPPSADHAGFKTFMLEQLSTGRPYEPEPTRPTVLQPGDWHAAKLERAEKAAHASASVARRRDPPHGRTQRVVAAAARIGAAAMTTPDPVAPLSADARKR